ncbi:MAG: sulfatase-like hydrolase/transferase [Planctomycetota bacterium]
MFFRFRCFATRVLLFCGCLVAQLAVPTTAAAQSKPPNIVFILADDLGYGELGCYGQTKIRTPHIDSLAKSGLRMTHHYSGAPVCAPARCTLLTGQHLGHAEIRGNKKSGNGRRFPGQWPITSEIVTIAEVLREAGYATGGFGKWGLGPTDTSGSPIKQGFDRFFGYNCQRNAHSYYPPFLDDDETQLPINSSPIPGHRRQLTGDVNADDYRGEVYAPDLILERALEFLDQHHDEPFFLYLPFVEPHVAMQPPQTWIDTYPEAWDAENGPYRGDNGYLPHPRPRAAYAAMISDLDEHVGTILERLRQHNLDDNTIVVFTSDNGPTHGGPNPKHHIGGAGCEFFNSTGGLKGHKGSVDEGGIRVPCIVRWPGVIQPGSTSSFASYFPDWFPTLAKIANAALPEQQLDGVDLNPALRGQDSTRTGPLIWNFAGYGGQAAIRLGDWKAVRRKLNRKAEAAGAWELYDLNSDPAEAQDVANDHPERLANMVALFESNRSYEADFPMRAYDSNAIDRLKSFLSRPQSEWEAIAQQPFADIALNSREVAEAREALAKDPLKRLRRTRAKEMEDRVLVQGTHRMPFAYKVFGDKPDGGRSLYISMHGGGGAPPAVNDSQWENQKRLYQVDEGVYVAPRAPTDTWNLWHQGHIDSLFVRLIENMVAFEDVRWDRVYLMGYSAGGDGVYQLAPRMSDRWAAAATMAGHPNETSPLGLRNVPFALLMGGKDKAYKRNEIASNWQRKLKELKMADPDGYKHFVKIFPGYGHWMNREDSIALPWTAKHTRDAVPERIVWVQDDVLHDQLYWLGVPPDAAKAGTQITASINGQSIEIQTETVDEVIVYLDDRMFDLDQPVVIRSGDQVLFQGVVKRTIGHLAQQFEARSDPELSFPASVKVQLNVR